MLDQERAVAVVNQGVSAQRCGDITLVPGQSRMVPISFVAAFAHVRDLKFDFNAMSDMLASRTEDGRPLFDLYGPLSVVDGFGRHYLDLYRGLRDLGAEVHLRATEKFIVQEAYLERDLIVETQVNRTRFPSKVAVSFTLPYDEVIWKNGSIIKIVLSQFETTRMPDFHVKYINRCDHMIVTSSYQTEVVRRSGVRVPVDVMTPGIDTDFFSVRPERDDSEFRVLILGGLTGRKNPLGAIQIFQQASQGDPSWRLTIKSRNAEGINEVRRIAEADSRIQVVVQDSHPNRVRDYYHSHDALLWPSKGEGVGLPPLEALSCGLEVVCSANSGMLDFIDEKWAWPIRTERMESAGWPGNLHGFDRTYVETYGDVGEWWVVSLEHGAQQLRRAHEAWKRGRGKGLLGAAYVRREHTLRQQAQSVLNVVEPYL